MTTVNTWSVNADNEMVYTTNTGKVFQLEVTNGNWAHTSADFRVKVKSRTPAATDVQIRSELEAAGLIAGSTLNAATTEILGRGVNS